MTNGTKNIVKCVIVLAVISLICVALLSAANVFLKVVPTLDRSTAAMINKMCPSGVDDQTAFEEDYFKMFTDEELAQMGFNLSDFNKKNGSAKNKVTAIYFIQKGDSAGRFVIESTGMGYYDMSVLTAFDNMGAISGVIVKAHTEDSFAGQILSEERFKAFTDSVIGKTAVPSPNEVMATTGATTSYSTRGLTSAVSVAAKVIQSLIATPSPLEV